MNILGVNILDIVIVAVLGVSVVFGLYRGFISGVLSVAALIGSILLAFMLSGQMASWLQGNKTLVDTLMYYTDAGSRISNLDLSLLSVSQVRKNSGVLAQIMESANLPEAFGTAFIENIGLADGLKTISVVLSETIVNVSLAIISFLICFLLSFVVMTFVIHMVNYVFELPMLRHLDSLIGGMFGFVRGMIVLYVFFTVVPIVMAVVPIEPLEALIEASQLAPVFESDLIMNILR